MPDPEKPRTCGICGQEHQLFFDCPVNEDEERKEAIELLRELAEDGLHSSSCDVHVNPGCCNSTPCSCKFYSKIDAFLKRVDDAK